MHLTGPSLSRSQPLQIRGRIPGRIVTAGLGFGLVVSGAMVSTPSIAAPTAAGSKPQQVAQRSDLRSTDPRAASDPATWSDDQLAARLVLAGVEMSSLAKARAWASSGIGGIVLFGSPPANLQDRLAAVSAAAPDGRLLVASDEEGGSVQRLGRLLGKLPSAWSIGTTRTPAQAQALAKEYAQKMKRIGVNVSLAPVADLAVPGAFISRDRRAFARKPATVASYVTSWSAGTGSGGVMSVVKHWPGHGSAADTHVGSGRTRPWSKMRKAELIPFNAAFAAGVPAVMVGHLIVPGLTERGVPASMSPKAMRKLRRSAGPNALIMTDSLSMGAVTSAMHQSGTRAAVRALMAGADIALVNTSNPISVVRAIRRAIASGTLPRARAIESARRVLRAQQTWG